jgi:copper chaperone CopZ
MEERTYIVDGMHCGSCRALVTEELEELAGIESVDVDLESKRVVVRGTVVDADIRALLDEIGYAARPA